MLSHEVRQQETPCEIGGIRDLKEDIFEGLKWANWRVSDQKRKILHSHALKLHSILN